MGVQTGLPRALGAFARHQAVQRRAALALPSAPQASVIHRITTSVPSSVDDHIWVGRDAVEVLRCCVRVQAAVDIKRRYRRQSDSGVSAADPLLVES
jgi:hypothetical protein